MNNVELQQQINSLLQQESTIQSQLTSVQNQRILYQKVLDIWTICDTDASAKVFIKQVVDTYNVASTPVIQ